MIVSSSSGRKRVWGPGAFFGEGANVGMMISAVLWPAAAPLGEELVEAA